MAEKSNGHLIVNEDLLMCDVFIFINFEVEYYLLSNSWTLLLKKLRVKNKYIKVLRILMVCRVNGASIDIIDLTLF